MISILTKTRSGNLGTNINDYDGCFGIILVIAFVIFMIWFYFFPEPTKKYTLFYLGKTYCVTNITQLSRGSEILVAEIDNSKKSIYLNLNLSEIISIKGCIKQ